MAAAIGIARTTAAQMPRTPELVAGAADAIALDGRLDEPAWQQAARIDRLTAIEPVQGAEPAARTEVRVLADRRSIYIGVRCHDDPDLLTAFAVARDAALDAEDHVKVVLGPLADGRTGYVLAVNPRGARYDALVADRGESENPDWNGAWEARTNIDANGWTLEIRVPVAILAFDGSADRWQFNVERRVQRLLERSRWATPRLDQRVTQLSRAGWITALPRFDLGLGVLVMPSAVARSVRSNDPVEDEIGDELDGSLDASWRITPELSAIVTVNSDFAEADVDRRQINLTRFPLFFPERRPFFYEGADAFDFGLGLQRNVVPFQSRRIGLVDGRTVPLRFGSKVVGRVGPTSVGALLTRTGGEHGLAPAATMGVVRVRQDVLAESNVGLLATTGDPLGRDGSYVVGADATYQTSRLFGDRNFLIGVFGLTMGRDDIDGNPGAYGIKVDYPNDDWDIVWQSWRIDEDFDPSLGFVPRPGVYKHRFGADYGVRPQNGWLRRQVFAFEASLFTDLSHRWQSYEIEAVPLDFTLESGDQFAVLASTQGDRPDV
ncbi:MAG: carbohydrate binding family 9 domain-containing protein, partial [Planctomycetes bacterium]|nr:carbohydrate binding family 9 domain-containing protein [Planctomycetota bacterium]